MLDYIQHIEKYVQDILHEETPSGTMHTVGHMRNGCGLSMYVHVCLHVCLER